jgi:hypothetical protein
VGDDRGSNSAFGVTFKPGSSTTATLNGKDGELDVEIEDLVAYGDGCWEVSLVLLPILFL